MPDTAVNIGRRGFFTTFTVLLVVWAAVLLTLAITVVPDGYWYSYFVIDYTVGFIRRGLAGEILDLFPREHYFGALAVCAGFRRWPSPSASPQWPGRSRSDPAARSDAGCWRC